MAKLERLSDVGVMVSDQKKARAFYTGTLGLKVRQQMKEFGYLALGTTLRGEDASITLWQPTPTWGPEMYERARKDIGIVTGIGFRTGNLEKTAASLKRRKVKVDGPESEEGMKFARIHDPDGNVLFAFEPPRPTRKIAGLLAVGFVTVVSRDAQRAHEFFTKALGLKGKRPSESMGQYSLSRKGTAVSPFVPQREMYDDLKDYDADLAHVGERTSIGFLTDDVRGLQDQLMTRGVRFSQKAQPEAWGGIQARFLDADDNEYAVVQMLE